MIRYPYEYRHTSLTDEQGIDRAVDREISMALFGLQKMGSGAKRTNVMYSTKYESDPSPELKRVLVYVTSLLNHYEGPFEAKRLGFAMMGAC